MKNTIELLRRQYLQLLDPYKLCLPTADLLRLPETQACLFDTIFRYDCFPFAPPDWYKQRVLKVVVHAIEDAFLDPDEDVCFP